jgi:hypothetical protein
MTPSAECTRAGSDAQSLALLVYGRDPRQFSASSGGALDPPEGVQKACTPMKEVL